MNRFCQECGKPINETDLICTECGTPLKTSTVKRDNSKKPFTKKQKLITSIIAAILILFSAFYMWGNSYASPEKTAKRFVTAIKDRDKAKLQKTAINSNGSFISKAEATALLTLANKEIKYINEQLHSIAPAEFSSDEHLFRIVENGKFLGLFKRHSIALKSQYIDLDLPFEDIDITMNGKEFPIRESEELRVVYGPMAPGIYELESKFSGEYTEVNAKEKVHVVNEYDEWVTHEVDLEADYVTLELFNEKNTPITNASIEINGKNIKFNKDLRIEKLGPLALDGSVAIIPMVETQWGKVKSDSVKMTDSYHEIYPETVNEKLTDELADVILKYGEEYVQAHAAYDVKKFTTATHELKEIFKSNFSSYKDYQDLFSGKLESIDLNFDDLSFDEDAKKPTVIVPANFHFLADFHDADEEADLEDRIDYCEVELQYDTKTKAWLVHDSADVGSWYNDFEPTKTMKGSQKLYSATITPITITDEDIASFMLMYNEKSVDSINARDFSIVEDYIVPGAPRAKEQDDYIDYLETKGITEELLSTTVESSKKIDDNTWEVVTIEKFTIITPDSSKDRSYRTKSKIKNMNGSLKLYELMETKEI
ncbi:zinc ribbon domain-containing protein [Lederbergia lenta]|uniref:zinc ribbon domain-containing protein n=1 Tax=Lederbergia lenta TaxID=1467 RepID=UPI002042015C|nr:zinc-ribbon domain-containing protein [Lederbergia lenta]MCM3111887.1 hypothetical protein [Lederbergia lenta]